MPPASTPPVAFRLRRPYANDEEFLVGDGHAIFRSGMVLIGAGPRPSGLIVRFELALRDGATLFRGEGKVVVHRSEADEGKPQGLEIRFTRLDARGKSLVDRVIRSREPSLGDSEPPPESLSFEASASAPLSIPPLSIPPDLLPPAASAPIFELATPLTPPSTAAPPARPASATFELATPLTSKAAPQQTPAPASSASANRPSSAPAGIKPLAPASTKAPSISPLGPSPQGPAGLRSAQIAATHSPRAPAVRSLAATTPRPPPLALEELDPFDALDPPPAPATALPPVASDRSPRTMRPPPTSPPAPAPAAPPAAPVPAAPAPPEPAPSEPSPPEPTLLLDGADATVVAPLVEILPEPVAEILPEPVAEVLPEPVAELVPEPVAEVVPASVAVLAEALPPSPEPARASGEGRGEGALDRLRGRAVQKIPMQGADRDPLLQRLRARFPADRG